jgi:cobyrinic acid a,c-diamide synthase
MTIPRILIAGTHSGCGKTTIASGIMAALTARGLRVQPFKVGPDFIDPSHHTRICGRISRNLDPFMMGDAGVSETFVSAAGDADIAVIEGVMGLFDGLDGTDLASTAHVARILRAPVVLVVDAKGVSRSVHAMIRGFRDFDPDLAISGVIFNRIGSGKHREMIDREQSVPAIGWVPRQKGGEVASRHLGLVMAHESGTMERYGRVIEESCSVDAILEAARSALPLSSPSSGQTSSPGRSATIAVARDEAFCFYYQDNLDRLVKAGAEIRFFSPMRDTLPNADAIYLGGGYPEIHAGELEASPCRDAVRAAAGRGVPVYGECGGLLYLCESLSGDREYRMTGIVPARGEMTEKIQALGYVNGIYSGQASLWARDVPVRGHEFHYSRVECDRDAVFAIRLERGKGIIDGKDGIVGENAIGAYIHSYFSDEFSRHFVAAAAACRNS